jgi:hypothetical protein
LKEVDIGKSLERDLSLWRYMSIDKFIDLLSNQKLFLTPLAYYQSSDPFEGFVPKVAFEATMKSFLDNIEEAEAASKQIEQVLLVKGPRVKSFILQFVNNECLFWVMGAFATYKQ